MPYPKELDQLIETLSSVPSVGKKTAERMAFWILNCDTNTKQKFLNDLRNGLNEIKQCKFCRYFVDISEDLCKICSDTKRSNKILCIISYPETLVSIESAGAYDGKYYILYDEINFKNKISSNNLNIEDLLSKIKSSSFEEIIIATDPTIEGNLTFNFICTEIKKIYNYKISRLAIGIPVGAKLSYMDDLTIQKSFKNRGE